MTFVIRAHFRYLTFENNVLHKPWKVIGIHDGSRVMSQHQNLKLALERTRVLNRYWQQARRSFIPSSPAAQTRQRGE